MKYLLVVFLSAFFVAGCNRKEKGETKQEAPLRASDLPNIQITLLDGNLINAKEFSGKTVLILFQPDCDHCQHEASEIEDNLAAFRDHSLYFVSSSPVGEVTKFANDYKLSGIPNVLFGLTTTESILNNFGPIQAPSIYIYSAEGKLVKHFNGQVEVGEIMKYL